MIKVGDKLLCKKAYKSHFYGTPICLIDIEYEVLSMHKFFFIKCERNIEYFFDTADIVEFFYSTSEIRKMKLEKLYND